MRVRSMCGALVAALACVLLSVSSAGARTVTVGQLFTPTGTCGADTFLQTGVTSGTSYTVPKAGVITSWSFEDGTTTVPGLKLKVGRSAGGGMYKILADATAGAQGASQINTYSAHIPVKAGDLIGLFTSSLSFCSEPTGSTADTIVFTPGDQAPGMTASYTSETGSRFAISAKVALDCLVPKLKGKTLTAAKVVLADASCRLGNVRKKESTGKSGIVLSQNPTPGKQLSPESKVAVVISSP